jgi:hypothetical protein
MGLTLRFPAILKSPASTVCRHEHFWLQGWRTVPAFRQSAWMAFRSAFIRQRRRSQAALSIEIRRVSTSPLRRSLPIENGTKPNRRALLDYAQVYWVAKIMHPYPENNFLIKANPPQVIAPCNSPRCGRHRLQSHLRTPSGHTKVTAILKDFKLKNKRKNWAV